MQLLRICSLVGLIWSYFVIGAQSQQTNENTRKRLIFPPGGKEPIATPTPASSPSNPSEMIELFFLSLKGDQVDAAYNALVRNSIVAERKEDISTLKERTKVALDSYGPILGYEVVEERKVGSHLLRKTCLSLNTDLPLRWRFYFYESEKTWRLIDLRVDDALVELFDDGPRARK